MIIIRISKIKDFLKRTMDWTFKRSVELFINYITILHSLCYCNLKKKVAPHWKPLCCPWDILCSLCHFVNIYWALLCVRNCVMNGSSSDKYILVSVLKKKEKTPGFSELQGSCNSLGSQGCMPCGFESAFVPCLVSVTAGYLGIIGGRRLEQVFPTSSNRKYQRIKQWAKSGPKSLKDVGTEEWGRVKRLTQHRAASHQEMPASLGWNKRPGSFRPPIPPPPAGKLSIIALESL